MINQLLDNVLLIPVATGMAYIAWGLLLGFLE